MNRFLERSVMAVVLTTAVTAGYLAIERETQASVPQDAGLDVASLTTEAGAPRLMLANATGGKHLVPPRRPDFKRDPKDSVTALHDWFAELNYDLDQFQDGPAHVPPAYLVSLPPDLGKVPETATRKRLWQIHADERLGRPVRPEDRLWVAALAERYKVPADNLPVLIRRVDVIPPSMALAQAAEESGWGTSRFARQGNAIFGQWTTSEGQGLVPKEREEGKDHKVRAFEKLIDSVRAYMLNLNTHRAYRELRRARATLRRSGQPLNGLSLARFLHRYSERGDEYVDAIRTMIQGNGLDRLDDARLMKSQSPEA